MGTLLTLIIPNTLYYTVSDIILLFYRFLTLSSDSKPIDVNSWCELIKTFTINFSRKRILGIKGI